MSVPSSFRTTILPSLRLHTCSPLLTRQSSICSAEEAHALCGKWRPTRPFLLWSVVHEPLSLSRLFMDQTQSDFNKHSKAFGAFRDPQAKVNTRGCDGELVVRFLGFCIVGSLTGSTSESARKLSGRSIETLKFPIVLQGLGLDAGDNILEYHGVPMVSPIWRQTGFHDLHTCHLPCSCCICSPC